MASPEEGEYWPGGELSHIGWAHPDTRDDVLAALRAVLPPLADDGTPDIPEDADDDLHHLWTTVAYQLSRHQDEESRAQIEALFEHDWIDTMYFGDVDAYRRLLRGEGSARAAFKPASFDVIEYYEDWYEEGEKARSAAQKRQQERRERVREDQTTGHYEGGTYVKDAPDVGRNDPCPCGSGVKYKYCCG